MHVLRCVAEDWNCVKPYERPEKGGREGNRGSSCALAGSSAERKMEEHEENGKSTKSDLLNFFPENADEKKVYGEMWER